MNLPRLLLAIALILPSLASADENFLGYVRGAEPLPENVKELYQIVTARTDKGKGTYSAFDSKTELEYGVTDRFSVAGAVLAQSVHVSGLIVDGYLPQDNSSGFKPSGFEGAMKYNFLSPVIDPVGFSVYYSLTYSWLDRHSGQYKDTTTQEVEFLFQKYFFDAQLAWIGNLVTETTYAKRAHINGLDPNVEWPTIPEMEIGLKIGTGLSYRFIPSWFAGIETVYETEYETEVGQERWTWFAGPSIHYASQSWWTTLTYFPQIKGGGEKFEGQPDDFHLIEKTKQEVRLKVGFNF